MKIKILGGHSVSEENTNTTQPQASGEDVEKLKANRDAILGEKKELQTKYQTLEATLTSLAQVVGIGEGEDLATKTKELLDAKNKETFEAMSETEKLAHRLETIENSLKEANQEKERVSKENLSLRIDDTLAQAFAKSGVNDPSKQKMALDTFKARNQITGLDNDSLLVGSDSFGVSDLVNSFLEEHKFLVSNTSSSGSGVKGGQTADVTAIQMKKAQESGNLALMVQTARKQTS